MERISARTGFPKGAVMLLVVRGVSSFDVGFANSLKYLFMTTKQDTSEATATMLLHMTAMTALFLGPFGALIFDSHWNRFKSRLFFHAIDWFLQVYNVIISVPALYPYSFTLQTVKSAYCVFTDMLDTILENALEADQFDLPSQDAVLTRYLRWHYFCNKGMYVLGSLLAPLAKTYYACLGEQDCYILPQGISLIFCTLTFITFVLGRKYYVIRPVQRNVGAHLCKCICYGAKHSIKEHKTDPKPHWLDHAEPVYGQQLVTDIKTVFNMTIIFSTIIVYGAINTVQKNEWAYKLTRLDGRILSYNFLPDHHDMIHGFFSIILVPVCEYLIDPVLKLLRMFTTLKLMIFGAICLALAFSYAGFVESFVKSKLPVVPGANEMEIRLFNEHDCTAVIECPSISPEGNIIVVSKGSYTNIVSVKTTFEISVKGECFEPTSRRVTAEVGDSVIMFLRNYKDASDVFIHAEHFIDSETFKPLLTVIGTYPGDAVVIQDSDGVRLPMVVEPDLVADHEMVKDTHRQLEVEPDSYIFEYNGRTLIKFNLYLGGTYLVSMSEGRAKLYTIREPNSVHVSWILPQMIMLGIGTIYFNITIDQLCYSEAPMSLKIFVLALNLFSEGFGVLGVVLINAFWSLDHDNKSYLLAIFMGVNACWIVIVGKVYKPMTIKTKLF